jgi:hypothetical protein
MIAAFIPDLSENVLVDRPSLLITSVLDVFTDWQLDVTVLVDRVQHGAHRLQLLHVLHAARQPAGPQLADEALAELTQCHADRLMSTQSAVTVSCSSWLLPVGSLAMRCHW